MNLNVTLECPQCGGPVELDETVRLFGCPYCRVRLYITATGEFRYWIPPGNELSEDLILVPYWRFKGISLNIKKGTTEARLIDTSFLAVPLKGFPKSLGLRTQSLLLRYLTPETPHFCLTPMSFKEIFPVIQERLLYAENLNAEPEAGLVRDTLYQCYIGESRSLVFQPYYIKGSNIHDAITRIPLPGRPELMDVGVNKPENWGLSFLAAICPECGWDLYGERDSLVLYCRNCNSAWSSSEGSLRKIDFMMVRTKGQCSLYLPFWRIKADVPPIELENYLHLIRFANLPRVPKTKWQEREFYFWLPAFKFQPERYLNIAKIATVNQPEAEPATTVPKEDIYTITLPPEEASEMIMALLFEIAKPRKTMIDTYRDVRPSVKNIDLVLIPFQENPYLFVQPALNMGISKGLLKYGRNI